jgi:hypothetical protein
MLGDGRNKLRPYPPGSVKPLTLSGVEGPLRSGCR